MYLEEKGCEFEKLCNCKGTMEIQSTEIELLFIIFLDDKFIRAERDSHCFLVFGAQSVKSVKAS